MKSIKACYLDVLHKEKSVDVKRLLLKHFRNNYSQFDKPGKRATQPLPEEGQRLRKYPSQLDTIKPTSTAFFQTQKQYNG